MVADSSRDAISNERVAEWVEGAKKVLADDLPAGHKLWKSWALDLADQVLALAKELIGEPDRDCCWIGDPCPIHLPAANRGER